MIWKEETLMKNVMKVAEMFTNYDTFFLELGFNCDKNEFFKYIQYETSSIIIIIIFNIWVNHSLTWK